MYKLEEAQQILQRTPVILTAWLTGLDVTWTERNEGPETFSARDVLGHLIHGEKTDWIPRAKIILSQKSPKRFEVFDRFAMFSQQKGKSVEELLDEFSALRANNLNELASLMITEERLAMTGIHPEFGEVTLRQLLATWVTHDMTHLAQIARVMAKRYKSEVGPWVEYIGVLNWK